MDIQTTGELVKWGVNGITLILLVIAASITIKKKNNASLAVLIIGNLLVFYFTRSPLLCWIVSIACIIWASMAKGSNQNEPDLKSPKSSGGKEKKSKAGNVIGLILGIGFVAGPLIGYFRQEASLSDPTTQGVLILFAVIGAFMIINNLFKLFEKGEEVSVTVTTVPASTTTVKQKAEKHEEEPEEKKIRCRFCKKLYSAEYNGCPYCKKK